MEQELNSTSKIAIIGAGPAGCMCAYYLQNDFDVTVFDKNEPLKTLLQTGGGRCNLAHAEYDFKELAKNYPRGEKFLYSVFSKFSTSDTINFFKKIGIETYTQEDMRIFPKSNSAKDVRNKFLKSLNRIKFIQKEITNLDFEKYDIIIVATGGHSNFKMFKPHNIIMPKPALVGLKTKEKFPTGISIKNVRISDYKDDIIFTHEGISGPLIFKISSINARKEFPYKITLNFCEEFNLQNELNSNSQKNISNLLSEHIPNNLAKYLLNKIGVESDTKCHKITAKIRTEILKNLHNYETEITGTAKGQETVTCGGIDLNEINPKTMESKLIKNLYFCGEVLDIDGFCGGFNLQNCWSTAYNVALSILNKNSYNHI